MAIYLILTQSSPESLHALVMLHAWQYLSIGFVGMMH